MKDKLYSAYSWIVDAGLPMGKEKAEILLEAANEIERLKAELDSWSKGGRGVALSKVQAQNMRLRDALEAMGKQFAYEVGLDWKDKKELERYSETDGTCAIGKAYLALKEE